MNNSDDEKQSLFDQFKEFYSQAESEGGTGDASLDMLLGTVEPSFSKLIQSLAVPHWFNEKMVEAVANDDLATRSSEIFEDLLNLPFIRSHPRGYAYHDTVRESLRHYLARKDPDGLRELSGQFVEFFTHKIEDRDSEEIKWEQVYLTLSFNEAEGFDLFNALFMEALHNRHYTACYNLVHMAEEQLIILSPQGGFRVNYYQGLLAFYLHNFKDAERIFKGLTDTELPVLLTGRVQLYLGLTLEAQGMWDRAEKVYRTYLKGIEASDENRKLSARLNHRLVETYLSEGDLRKAEIHAKKSHEINKMAGDRFGEATNYEILGRIYEKLRIKNSIFNKIISNDSIILLELE